MGVDWYRMRPRPEADPEELARLIDLQAEAFHKSGFGIFVSINQEEKQHWQLQYRASCDRLEELLEIPKWDEAAQAAADDPELDLSMRVYPITGKNFFPPSWRFHAYRTFLPDELKSYLRIWKNWAKAVSAGCYRSYLLDLYLHDLTSDMHSNSQCFEGIREMSLDELASWAKKPNLVAACERILEYELPPIHPAPVPIPVECDMPVDLTAHVPYQSTMNSLRDLIAITRGYDRNVRGNRKIRYYEGHYQTFEKFLASADDDWLHQFFEWAEKCCSKGMGFYLDY